MFVDPAAGVVANHLCRLEALSHISVDDIVHTRELVFVRGVLLRQLQ